MLQTLFLQSRIGEFMPVLKPFSSLYELATVSLSEGLAMLGWICLPVAIFCLIRARGQMVQLKGEQERLEQGFRQWGETETTVRKANDTLQRQVEELQALLGLL